MRMNKKRLKRKKGFSLFLYSKMEKLFRTEKV